MLGRAGAEIVDANLARGLALDLLHHLRQRDALRVTGCLRVAAEVADRLEVHGAHRRDARQREIDAGYRRRFICAV